MKFFRQVLAAPVKMALQICAFFPKIDKFKLIELIWKIGREPDYARSYIFLTHLKKGLEPARETGEEIFREYPSDQTAGMMGMVEFDQYNLEGAKTWLGRGRQCPEQNPESLLYLELQLAYHIKECDPQEVLIKILSRRDLPMNFTSRAMGVQAELFLRQRKWDNADEVLEQIFRLEEVQWLRWMKWTIAKARGDEAEAQRQLRMSIPKGQKTVPHMHMALGWYYLGDIAKTREFLVKAQQEGITKKRIVEIDPELGALLESDSFNQQAEEAN